jgi:hypothetical protein
MFLSHIYNNFIYTPSTKNSISEEFQAQNTRASTTIQLCMCPKRNSRQFVIYYMYPWITQLFNWQGVCGCGWNTHMQGKNQISIKWTFECKTWTLIIGYIIIDFPYVELAKTQQGWIQHALPALVQSCFGHMCRPPINIAWLLYLNYNWCSQLAYHHVIYSNYCISFYLQYFFALENSIPNAPYLARNSESIPENHVYIYIYQENAINGKY